MSMRFCKDTFVFCIRKDSHISVDNLSGKINVSIFPGDFSSSEIKKMKNYLEIVYLMSEDIKQDLKKKELNEIGGVE